MWKDIRNQRKQHRPNPHLYIRVSKFKQSGNFAKAPRTECKIDDDVVPLEVAFKIAVGVGEASRRSTLEIIHKGQPLLGAVERTQLLGVAVEAPFATSEGTSSAFLGQNQTL